MTTEKVTLSQFEAVQKIYDYMNDEIFGGSLGQCILNFSRKSKTNGFFAPDRWGKNLKDTKIHEISLNPEQLGREPIRVVSTLVHEMAHLWQQDFGKPSPGYHNKQWAAKMIEIGLTPTDTGSEGGKMTGRSVTHLIDKKGPFEIAFKAMPKEFLYPFVCVAEMSDEKKAKAKSKNKIKYTCPSCETNAWGKPELKILCQDCGELFETEEN